MNYAKTVVINNWRSLGYTQKDALYNFLCYEKEGYVICFLNKEDSIYWDLPEWSKLMFVVNKIYTAFTRSENIADGSL